MKKSIIFILIAISISIIACGDKDPQQSDSNQNTQSAENGAAEAVESSADLENVAVCLWPKVGLRSEPGRGKNAKYLTTIYFGEKVTLLGKEKESDDRTYWKMQLSDGSEGWADEYLFGSGGELAVATASLPLYKRPDLATLQGKNFDKGDILVLKPAQNGWREAVGFEKKREGWIQDNGNFSQTEEDIVLCMLYRRAMTSDNADEKKKQLETISSNATLMGSAFSYLINDAMAGKDSGSEEEIIPEIDVKDNELFIIASKLNVRSAPTIEEDNVVFQIEKGNVATIIEKAAEREQVNGMEDYWYRISYNGQEGWIFGYHTSKRIGL